MTGDTLRDVPELFENDIGECIEARNAHLGSVRDLGPPDMVHVIKTPYPIRANAKETGSYHYVLGIDGSSSANFAAYLHTLTYNFDVPVGWFGKTGSPTHQIRTGTYCCYNSFSRCDVRVTVSYPGGVEVEVVMPGGHPGPDPTPRFWQEVELSAVIRSLLYTSYEGYRVPALRRLSPMMTQADETRFLETASALFQHGWVLGATSEVQQASLMRNHLTEALRRYFFDSGRHAQAIEFFAPLAAQHPEASAVLAESYIGANLEVEAVQILHNAISGGSSGNTAQRTLSSIPGYPALHVQADLMLSKGRKDAALGLAKMAVKLAPSEFQTWAKLAEVHTDRGEYQQALLALNACPMFTIVEKDVPRLSHQTRARFPIKHEIAGPNGEYDDQGIRNQDESLLLRLPAPNLRGTFSLAYKALTKLVEKVGWDDLLLLRSSVFVMEGEYQQLQQHQQDETNDVTSDIDGASNPSAKAVGKQPATAAAAAIAPGAALYEEDEFSNNNTSGSSNSNEASARSKKLLTEKYVPSESADITGGRSFTVQAEAPVETTTTTTTTTTSTTSTADAVASEPVASEPVVSEPAPAASVDEKQPAAASDEPAESTTLDESAANVTEEVIETAENEPTSSPTDATKDVTAASDAEAGPEVDNATTAPAESGSSKKKNKKNKKKKKAGDAAAPAATAATAEDDANVTTPESVAEDSEPVEPSPAIESQPETAAEVVESVDNTAEPVSELAETMQEVSLDDDTPLVEPTAAEPVAEAVQEDALTAQPPSQPEAPAPPAPRISVDSNTAVRAVSPDNASSLHDDTPAFMSKRLCERWLDNLFMVLFEDLRAYTMWRTEMAQSQQHSLGKHDQITMMHTLGEWESLGELALRLGHIPEAKDAFTRALHHRFSVKAWKNLLTMHVADNNVKDALIAVVQLTVYNERWYDEMIYPSFVTSCMLQLIKSHGMSKISNMITGMNLIVPVQKLIQRYFTFAAEFHVEGSQW